MTGQGLETEEFFSDVFAQEPGFSDWGVMFLEQFYAVSGLFGKYIELSFHENILYTN